MKNRILLGLLLLASGFGFAQSSGGGFTQFSKLKITTNPTDNPLRGKLLVRDTVTGNIDKIQFSDLPLNFTLTTADSSGVATLSAGNLNIPNYGLNSIPYTGTPIGKPITGDFEVDGDYVTSNGFNLFTNQGDLVKKLKFADDGTMEIVVENTLTSKYSALSFSDTYFNFGISSSGYDRKISISEGVPMTLTDSEGLGFIGNTFFNKLNDPNAFAQLGDVQNATGTESHTDTAYSSGAPFTVLAGVTAALPNNSGIIYNEQTPDDIASFYTGGKITGRDGDGLSIMIYFKCTPSSINSELDIWIDIGGAVGELYRETKYFRGTTVKSVLYTLPAGYTRATWETNGGTIYVKPSVDMTFYGMNYNFLRTHKAK